MGEITTKLPPTPYFVLDLATLERFYCRFRDALERHWPYSTLAYSFKTNSLPWLLGHLREWGAWAEVVSDTEYELALAVGYEPNRIVFNGPIKGRDRLRAALLARSMVNLDSAREVRWACELARERPDRTLTVGVRVNWDLESYCPGESPVPEEDSRFGFSPVTGELDRVLNELAAAGIHTVGLHLHTSSRTRGVHVFRALAEEVAELMPKLGLDLDYLDIGGGFFGGEEPGHPTFDEYISTVRNTLAGAVDPTRTRLVVEPGASLIAVPVELHTSVLDVKETARHTVVTTDGSRNNIDPIHRRRALYRHRIITDGTPRRQIPLQVVCGFTCMEHDRLMRLQDQPSLAEGDRIVYEQVGSYTMTLQPNFIEFLPDVYVRVGEELWHVRRKWGVSELLQGSELSAAQGERAPETRPYGVALEGSRNGRG